MKFEYIQSTQRGFFVFHRGQILHCADNNRSIAVTVR